MKTNISKTATLRRIAYRLPAGFLIASLALLLTTFSAAARAQTGVVLGCGFNGDGELGNGATTNSSLITPALNVVGVKSISCGYNHTLALDANGNVWAWGSNNHGQLGTGDTANRDKPVVVLDAVRAIAAGGFHSLALRADGTVWAWGSNTDGQLGTGDTTDRHSPTQMSGSDNAGIKAIACGLNHSLILCENSLLYGCGFNADGELGVGDNTNRSSLTFITDEVVAMSAGAGHTLIQRYDNSVAACGFNAFGQLGDGTTTSRNFYVTCATNARAIAAGQFHSLMVRQDGKVVAWGLNNEGQLGDGTKTNRLSPIVMPGASFVKAVAGGGAHTLVLTAGGKALAAGLNNDGQLGTDNTISSTKLKPVKDAVLISAISAGTDHSIFLKPFTNGLATGYNGLGQLGIGSTVVEENAPVKTKGGNNFISVSIGDSGSHSLLLRADGTVWACGDNEFGQLGQGTTTDSDIPVKVKGPGGVGFLSNIIAIAAGNFHNMALCANGTVFTWGRNSHGQLGLGDTNDRFFPVQAPGNNIFAIACGGYHSLLIAVDGSVYACGYNGDGQLGDGGTADLSSFNNTGILGA